MLAPFEQALSLPDQLSLELAAKNGSAVAIRPIDEGLAGDAGALTLPVLQLQILDATKFLDHQHAISTGVLSQRREGGNASPAVCWVAPYACGQHSLISALPLLVPLPPATNP